MGQRLIGVDVGGTKVSVAVLEDGRLSRPRLRPTDLSSSEALVEQLVTAVSEEGPADAVGLGVPSVIDFASGTARSSVNIPLQGVPLRHLLSDRLQTPTFVDNDATVAALARGAPPAADFPHPASLEHHAAGRALDRLGEARGIGDGLAVVAAAQRGDAAACEALRILGGALGVGIANAINTFDPDLVVVGGGVSRAGDLLLEPAREAAARFVIPGVGSRTEIRLARWGPEAGVRGAALLAGQELEAHQEGQV